MRPKRTNPQWARELITDALEQIPAAGLRNLEVELVRNPSGVLLDGGIYDPMLSRWCPMALTMPESARKGLRELGPISKALKAHFGVTVNTCPRCEQGNLVAAYLRVTPDTVLDACRAAMRRKEISA